jgi:hypothetical protein
MLVISVLSGIEDVSGFTAFVHEEEPELMGKVENS